MTESSQTPPGTNVGPTLPYSFRIPKKRQVQSLATGAVSHHWRVAKRNAFLQMFFVYLCVWQVAPGSTCGNNPLRRFQPLSRMLGKDINALLTVLRTSNPSLFQQVENDWRSYADCVRHVDTGYFKRSGPPGWGQRLDGQGKGDGEGELARQGGWGQVKVKSKVRGQGSEEGAATLIGALADALTASASGSGQP